MNLFGHDWAFWVALVVAAMIRVATSPFHSIWRAVIMVVTSVFIAWAFADAAVDLLKLDKTPVGALLALTADGVVRLVFAWLQDPAKLVDLWRRFRGGAAK
jgi:hypothetical protein